MVVLRVVSTLSRPPRGIDRLEVWIGSMYSIGQCALFYDIHDTRINMLEKLLHVFDDKAARRTKSTLRFQSQGAVHGTEVLSK